jgi:hypothetical protein
MNSHASREHYVSQMRANFRMNKLMPDEADQLLLQAYIDGTACLHDLLMHARQFTTSAAYTDWLRAKVQTAINDPPPKTPHDQVITEMCDLLERKYQEGLIGFLQPRIDARFKFFASARRCLASTIRGFA